MKRSSALALQEPRWIDVADSDLQLQIIPSASAETAPLLFSATDEKVIRRICRKLFVGFRNYFEDDGVTPVDNSLASRVELFNVGPVRSAIASECDRLNSEAVQGEGNAGSD